MQAWKLHQLLLRRNESSLRGSCDTPASYASWARGGNVGSEFPAKEKGKGKAKAEGSKAGSKRALDSEATSKPLTSSSAKPSCMKAAVARAEKKKRKAGARVPMSLAPIALVRLLS